mmetsp:Transcript_57123/g.90540  ORF Transcript_57123/g.90540 Transcript_57123/m.90540 type:complete len:853 (-) Transcript_57123:61-2619(-)
MRRELDVALKASSPFRSAFESPPSSAPALKSAPTLIDDFPGNSEIRRPSPIAPPSAFVKAKVKNTFIHISDNEEATNTSSDGTSRLAMSDPLPMPLHGRTAKPPRAYGAKNRNQADPERASAKSSSSNDGRTSVAHSSNGTCPGTEWDFPNYQPPTVQALADLQRAHVGTCMMFPIPFATSRIVNECTHTTPEFVSVLSDDADSEHSEAGPPPKSMARVWEVWTKPDESQSSSMDESTTYASTLSGPQKRTRRGGKRMNRPCHSKAKEQSTVDKLLITDYSLEEQHRAHNPFTDSIVLSAGADAAAGPTFSAVVCNESRVTSACESLNYTDSLHQKLDPTSAGTQVRDRIDAVAACVSTKECVGEVAALSTKPREQLNPNSCNSVGFDLCTTAEQRAYHKNDFGAHVQYVTHSEPREAPASLVGKHVLLQGLVRMPEFNGAWGNVVSYDEELKRFSVSVPRSCGPPLLAKLLLKNLVLPGSSPSVENQEEACQGAMGSSESKAGETESITTPSLQAETCRSSKRTLRRALLRKIANQKLTKTAVHCENAANLDDEGQIPDVACKIESSAHSSNRQRSQPPIARPPSCSIISSNAPASRELRRQRSCPANASRSKKYHTTVAFDSVLVGSKASDFKENSIFKASEANHSTVPDFINMGAKTNAKGEPPSRGRNASPAVTTSSKAKPMNTLALESEKQSNLSSVDFLGEIATNRMPNLGSVSVQVSQDQNPLGNAKVAQASVSCRANQNARKACERSQSVGDAACARKNIKVLRSPSKDFARKSNAVASTTDQNNATTSHDSGVVRRKWTRHVNDTPTKPPSQHEYLVEPSLPEKKCEANSNASATKWRPSLRL